MRVIALACLMAAAPAAAEVTEALAGSTVTLRATEAPGAVAEVVFYNDASNGAADNRDFTLIWAGLEVGFRFRWDATPSGDDAIWIAPPDGYVADPDHLILRKWATGTALIRAYDAPGM